MADQDRGGQRAAALLGQQLRSVRGDELGQLGRELLDSAVEAAQIRDLLTRDPDPGTGGQLAQLPVDAVKRPRLVERFALQRGLELGAQLEQVPAQPVHRAGALGDEIVAVLEQQPDLHRPLVQVRDREPLDTVLDDRSGDGERVDLVRLAWLALALARCAHPVRRHPDNPLARRQQRLLKPARTRAAVLDRPHPLLVEPAGPPDRGQMPRPVRLDLAAAAHLAGSLVDRRERVRALVGVRPDHGSHCPPCCRHLSNSPASGPFTLIRRPFRRPVMTWTACSSPRWTLCKTVCRAQPRRLAASSSGR